VGASRIESDEQALRVLVDPSFDPKTTVILSSGSPLSPSADFSGSCSIEELIPDRVRLKASLSSPGVLLLVDTYDPGWHVRVDRKEAPLLRANLAFRAVALPAGSHEVELLYRPSSVAIGSAISLATLLLGVLAAFKLR
jgi:hypothetical protein